MEGIPEESGVFNFTVKLLATKEEAGSSGGSSGGSAGNTSETAVYLDVTMLVADKDGNVPEPTNNATLESLQEQINALQQLLKGE